MGVFKSFLLRVPILLSFTLGLVIELNTEMPNFGFCQLELS